MFRQPSNAITIAKAGIVAFLALYALLALQMIAAAHR